jgi:nicotinate-nucleotide adenylyltransferase
MLAGVRRALLGGTFDPPHLAHLVAAEAAYRQLGVEVVTFLPAGAPWQKADTPMTDAAHRWEMTRLAVAGVDYFEADAREVHRDGWTYTAETLATFDPADEIILVLGADAAAGVPTWQRSGEVLARAGVAVAPRPGTDRAAVETALGSGVAWLDMPSLEISGTGIRRMAAAGRSIRFLVREGVWEYAVRHGLYPPDG